MNDNVHVKYRKLLDYCKTLPATRTAVAHPCDESSLRGAVDAARLDLIAPILCGPRARIEGVAKQYGIDIKGIEIVDAPYSHASAATAVGLVREGRSRPFFGGIFKSLRDQLAEERAPEQRPSGAREGNGSAARGRQPLEGPPPDGGSGGESGSSKGGGIWHEYSVPQPPSVEDKNRI